MTNGHDFKFNLMRMLSQKDIHVVDRSEIGVNKIPREIGLNKSTFHTQHNNFAGVIYIIPPRQLKVPFQHV